MFFHCFRVCPSGSIGPLSGCRTASFDSFEAYYLSLRYIRCCDLPNPGEYTQPLSQLLTFSVSSSILSRLVVVSAYLPTMVLARTSWETTYVIGHINCSTQPETFFYQIFLAGLVLQAVSFIFFSIVLVLFIRRVRALEPKIWTRDSDEGKTWLSDWRTLAYVAVLSCIMIIVMPFLLSSRHCAADTTSFLQIRSIYRLVEGFQGSGGSLQNNEATFYGLDTLPLFIAVVVYVPFHPGRFLWSRYNPVSGSSSVELGVQDPKPGHSAATHLI